VKLDEGSAYCSQCGTATGVRDVGAMPVTARPMRLTRSIYDKKIAGVCGGLGEYLQLDPTLVRLIWLGCTICFPPLLLAYLAAWIIVPKEAPRLLSPFSASVPQPQG